ncbi:MAG: FtsQ-type POTRA domain-containing protein [Lachnospiraceae bacterium]|nr:FtsQ-type POTRA domain-containing protein [Lachnospiraceae bacterium]
MISRKKENKKTIYRNRHLGLKIGLITTAVVLTAALGVFYYIKTTYTVNTVYVEGNAHYTDEEITERIMTGRLSHNSIYLNFKYRNQEIEDIPFVSAIEVEIEAPDTVRIRVYEKSFAGYVSYLGRYMYFDRDGTIVESSEIKTAGVPEVTGLKFDHVVMYEKLPVENENIFARILDITQSLDKYELKADRLAFDREYKVTLYFEEVRVQIGDNSSIDEKFSRLKSILPELQGKKGVLQMENFTGEAKIVPFQEDKK